MRSCRFLLLAFALVLCLHAVAAVPAPTHLARRQDESPAESAQEPTATTRESSRPSSSATPRPSSTTPSERPSSTRDSTTSSSIIPSESAANEAATTTSNNVQPSASSSADADSAPKLPIQPKITPAFGLAGVILLLSGLVYAVIGIKNQWLYVFASAAYLSSLAVTVLIVYLMNPPVSNAVQGAFFVAAAITGLLFGALALVFADITDGLGCLLGGFCLSMWLLSVKDGGLITSTSGRAVFIGCMSAAGYALAWSHYTRNHGLIACISFSGATITMLGVDCFSGAGWKEFWLYLWNLNPDTFPLNTNTYPMTKGMKAELAGVVILSVLGIVSQLRLWKLIKEHREQTSAQRIEKRQAQEREEAERGRKLEDNFQKERAQWEAAYGDKMHPKPAVDSCVSTVTTTTGSFTSSSLEPTPQPKDGLAISNVQEIDAVGNPVMPTRPGSNHEPNTISSARPSSDIMALDGVSRNLSVKTLKPSAPPPPVVVPLPFKIPQEDDDESQGSDNASVSAIPDMEEENFDGRRSLSKPLSSTSAQRHLSGATPDHSEYGGGMIIPHIEDDRASSIAATIDEADDVSLPDLSPPHSPVDPNLDADTAHALTANEPGDSISQMAISKNPEVQDASSTATKGGTKMDTEKPNCAEEAPTSTRAGPRQSLTVSTDPKSDASRTDQESLYSPRPRSDTVVESGGKSQQPKSPGSVAPSSNSHTEQSQSVSGSFNGALSGRLSKVTQSYRTNEWAKHLETAETPDLDEIPVPDSPGVAVHHERPAPVPDEIAKPLTVVKRDSRRVSSDNAVYQNGAFVRSNSSTRLSQAELQSVSRSPSICAPRRLSRAGSTAHLARVTEPSSNRTSSGPLPMPDNTLLGQREALVRRRTSSQSFNLQPASTNTLIMNGEDMPLAARKRALQNKHQKPPSSSQKWQKKSGWAAGNQISGFDSHQPKRTSTSGSDQKREALLADWRESIRQDNTPDQSAAAMAEEQRRAALNAKRQSEMEQQHQTMVAQQRDSMRQHMMRNNDMLDAHREAMRKLQAAANNRA